MGTRSKSNVFIPVPRYPDLRTIDPTKYTGDRVEDYSYVPSSPSALYFQLSEDLSFQIKSKGLTLVRTGKPVADMAGPWYIPLRFIAVLAADRVDWDTIKAGGPTRTPELDVELKLLEEEYSDDWAPDWQPCTNVPSDPLIPVRSADGTVYATRSQLKEKDNREYLETAMDSIMLSDVLRKIKAQVDEEATPAAYRPSRYAKIPLPNGLIFVVGAMGTGLFRGTDPATQKAYPTAEEVLEAGVQAMKGRCATTVKLEQEGTKPDPAKWRMYSEHPFGLYTTYVHNDDWSAYMASLGPEPIRPFDPIASKLLEDLTKATEQEVAQRKAQENKALAGVLDMTAGATATTAGVKKGATQKNAPTVYTRGGGEFPWRRRLVNVRITYDKLAWAAGQTRPRTQQDVMGKTSASQLAVHHDWTYTPPPHITKKRNANQMANGLYVAEWTHLSAFSYGGLLNDRELTYSTSQIPENLVLATSETNSLMTRYEKAWQRLVIGEVDLATAYDKNSTHSTEARLDVTLNGLDTKLLYDTGSVSRYTIATNDWTSGIAETATAKQAAVLLTLAPRITQSPAKTPVKVNDLLSLSAAHPCIAHTVEYKMSMEKPSLICGGRRLRAQKVVFYPFMRPFFHHAESIMDQYLLDELKKRAEVKVKTVGLDIQMHSPTAAGGVTTLLAKLSLAGAAK